MAGSISVGQLILTSVTAIASVLILAVCGVVLARKEYFPKHVQKSFSKMYLVLFLPCLLLAGVPATVNPSDLMRWWPLVVIPTINIILGVSVSYILGFILGKRGQELHFISVSAAFSNTVSVPLYVAASIVETVDFVTEGSTPEATLARGTAYALIYNVVNNIIRWSIGFELLRPPEGSQDDVMKDVTETNDTSTPPTDLYYRAAEIEQNKTSEIPLTDRLKRVLTPPFYAIIVALVIGLIPPVRDAIYPQPGQNAGDVPLGFIYTALKSLGDMAIPLAVLLLGAKMSSGPLLSGEGLLSNVIITTAVRLVIVPALGLGVVYLFQSADLLLNDPIFRLMLLIQNATPTATNIVIMCTLHNTYEREIGTVMFVGYFVGVFTLTAWISIFLTFQSGFY